MINEDLPVHDVTAAVEGSITAANAPTEEYENAETAEGKVFGNDELAVPGTFAVSSASSPTPLGSETSANRHAEELSVVLSAQSESDNSGDQDSSDGNSSFSLETSDDAEPSSGDSDFSATFELSSDSNRAPMNACQIKHRKISIARWGIFVAAFISIVVLAAVIAICIQDLGDASVKKKGLSLLSSSPSGDGGPVPVVSVQLKGSPLADDIHATNNGLASELMAWSSYYDEEEGGAVMTERLQFLIDLLAPIVSRLSEREGHDIRDYVASRRNDETIVLKGSPQHHALAWLSHAIVCAQKTGETIVTSQSRGWSSEPTNGSSSKEEYECASLLSRSQLVNRYALATMYFAWNGKSWQDAEGWLSYHPEKEFPASSSLSRSSKDAMPETHSSIDVDFQRYPSDVCTWKGVTCRHQPLIDSNALSETSNVTTGIGPGMAEERLQPEGEEEIAGLDLSGTNLVGYMGTVKEIRLLERLRDLDLSSNRLKGPVPGALGRLEQLRSLDLSRNFLSGALPASISRDLAFLETIRLEGNFFADGLRAFRFAPPSCREVPFRRFSADCLGTKPEVECPCCTSCCGTVPPPEDAVASHLRGSEVKRRKKEIDVTVCHERNNARVSEDDHASASVGMDTDDA